MRASPGSHFSFPADTRECLLRTVVRNDEGTLTSTPRRVSAAGQEKDVAGRRCRSKRCATPLPMSLGDQARSVTPRSPCAVPTEGVGWWPHSTPPAHADNRSLVLFDKGDEIVVRGGENGIRFLLVSKQPLEEPVAWYGPVVMNTQAELQQAFDELERGTF